MDKKKEQFLKRLHETFRIEAEEHIRMISSGLLELEKNPGRDRFLELVETTFREAHSLKGAARSVDMRDVESLCQRLETVLSSLKQGKIALSLPVLDLMHQAVNIITQIVFSAQNEQTESGMPNIRKVIRQLDDITTMSALPDEPEDPGENTQITDTENAINSPVYEETQHKGQKQTAEMQINPETVRIPLARLDPILLQAEEMIMIKMTTGQRIRELMEIDRSITSLSEGLTNRAVHPQGMNLWEKEKTPARDETWYKSIGGKVNTVIKDAEQDLRAIKRMVDEHLDSMKQLMMLPASTLVEVFPKFVRDLARDQGKEVELIISGSDIEVDKRILEELKDPLIHLLRNCINHGIKKPDERARLNKPQKGTINLTFGIKDSRQLEIIISDDGEGIDTGQVLAAAVKAGIIAKADSDKLQHGEIISLIFDSGVTTSPIITDISGRGLGLAIVREKIEKHDGAVLFETTAGGGTTFRIIMPLTLATFRGVLVRVREHFFIFPTINVERVTSITRREINTVENHETMKVNGEIISLVKLNDVLMLPLQNIYPDPGSVEPPVFTVIVISGGSRIAFQVDEVIDEQQVLVKSLGRQLKRVRNISGATVLSTGKVVPILNVLDLMKSAVTHTVIARPVAVNKNETDRVLNILVAEDSITSRTLIRNILETAGYRVSTAVDGMDAYTRVRSEKFDLVVSDVDMPRMNGFELTTKIRSDKKCGDLPVILITALESREDRERGIEAGANAYIVKSSFDQNNLLEVIKRLI